MPHGSDRGNCGNGNCGSNGSSSTSLASCQDGSSACAIKLSGSVMCMETEEETIFCWNLLVDNCQTEQLCKVALSLDVRSFFTNEPYAPGPGIFATATWSVTAESGLMPVIDPAYQGTGQFLTIKTLPQGRTAFTLCAVFPRCTADLLFMKMLASVFTLKATLGRSNITTVNISNYIAPTCNCATCDDPDVVYCDFDTPDDLVTSANDAVDTNTLQTNNPPGPASSEGRVYQFTSFIIDGVEQLTSPVFYSVLNSNVAVSSLPNNHVPIILYQQDGITNIRYLGNFNAALGALFQSVGVDEAWKAILNPSFATYNDVDRVRIVYPEIVATWSITLRNFDNSVTVFSQCANPESIELTPTLLRECVYVDWDEMRKTNIDALLLSSPPITWTILDFTVNGISLGGLPFTYQIANSGQLTDNVPTDTYYNNNATALNDYFTLVGVQNFWMAAATGNNLFQLTYPNTAYNWVMTIRREFNNDIYYYTNDGFVSNQLGFTTSNTVYDMICESRPLSYQMGQQPVDLLNREGEENFMATAQAITLAEAEAKAITLAEDEEKTRSGAVTRSRVQLFQNKKYKDSTPLQSVAPKSKENVIGLLKERAETIRTWLADRLSSEAFQLYLYGSQVRGVSTSGHPDIDIWFVCDSLDKRTSTVLLEELMQTMPFKLDIAHVSSTILEKNVLAIEL